MFSDHYKMTYKGAHIYRNLRTGMYSAMVEDGMVTYSFRTLRADTLNGIKQYINRVHAGERC